MSLTTAPQTEIKKNKGDQRHIELALNFFFLLYLDKEKAIFYASKICRNVRGFKDEIPISFLQRIHQQFKKLKKTYKAPEEFFGVWSNTSPADLQAWQHFLTVASVDEIEAILFAHIFGFSLEDVSRTLGVQEGSLRFRLNHGLKKLGQSVILNPTKKNPFSVVERGQS